MERDALSYVGRAKIHSSFSENLFEPDRGVGNAPDGSNKFSPGARMNFRPTKYGAVRLR